MPRNGTSGGTGVRTFVAVALGLALQPGVDVPQKAAQSVGATPASGSAVASAPADVEFFRAHEITAGVELSWMAASEKDIDGFKVYRREPSIPLYLLLNNEGLINPWRFDYIDGSPQRGHTYLYVLGVVHSDGSEQLSQPAEITTSPRD